MRVLVIAKRHYTNRDAMLDRFGRVYWIPKSWHEYGVKVAVLLVDYHSFRVGSTNEGLPMQSFPAFDPRSLRRISAQARRMRPDTVLASGDCMIGLLGLHLARRLGAKFVFDVYDDYRTFGAYRVFLGWDAMTFLRRRANLVMYASRRLAERHDFDSRKIVVPNGFDASRFLAIPMTAARANVDLPEEGRLVGYFGSMTPEHGVATLITAVRQVRKRHPDVRLVLCGKSDPSTDTSGDEVIYRGLVPHEAIPSYMNGCDVLALPYLRGSFIDNASSCKIAEYLACRRPIVATKSPNFTENFPAQAGSLKLRLVRPGDAAALAHAIERQLEDPAIVDAPADMQWERIAMRLKDAVETLSE